MMNAVRAILTILMTLVVMSVPVTAGSPRAPAWWPYAMTGAVVVLLTIVIFGAIRAWKLQENWEAAASSSTPEFQDANWRWAGAIYYNPNDPQLMVHRKIGAGFTFNFAHPRAKTYLALFVFIFGFVILAVTTSL